jgi:hypothetical protein
MISVTERERRVEGAGFREARVGPATQAYHPSMRRGSRAQEPLVVEIAWLIIEGAVVSQRLCRAQEP